MRKLLNSELNRLTLEEFKFVKKIPINIVLDNIRSQHNVGAVFRTADAFVMESIYLCGITATPPNAEIHKSALGSENSVHWQYFKTTLEAIQKLKNEGYTIISIEQVENSSDLMDFEISDVNKYAIVFGNEVKGVEQQIVDLSDYCIEIAQHGTKHSLNISISAGIVIWEFYKKFKTYR
jgi:tRNA G18 (ribose-2'-O)-methylase SpoU